MLGWLTIRRAPAALALLMVMALALLGGAPWAAGAEADPATITKAAEGGNATAQCLLGSMYAKGQGVRQDAKLALLWYTKAAMQGHAEAQAHLGVMYGKGDGVAKNFQYGYVWSSLAAAQGREDAAKNKEIIAKLLTPEQMKQAQELAVKLQAKISAPPEKTSPANPPASSENKSPLKSSGTGFLVTEDGYILTCQHVVAKATSIKVKVGDRLHEAQLVRVDPANDLAVLKISGSFPALAFSANRSAHLGQEVFTIGYPNPALQGVSPKLTKGDISSLAGFHDDIRLYQISVAVQPGNSGGPLLDMDGNIDGVIVAMLDAQATFKVSGSLPQNVNYAVKSSYARAILDTIPEAADHLPPPAGEQSYDKVVDRVEKAVVMVLAF